MRLNRVNKRKAANLKWSKNANAAKARKRMERELERWPEMKAFFPWKITIQHRLDGAKFTLPLNSSRHGKRFLDFVTANYEPETKYGGQERL